MAKVDPGSWTCTENCRFDASTGSPAGAKLPALVTGTSEPASSPGCTLASLAPGVRRRSPIGPQVSSA